MGEEKEYEVESITQARVEKKKKRGKDLVWKYCVRWKGYGPDDDTWEPVESFEGSEEMINRFWERTNLGGRDYRDMRLFKAGEEFLLTGPPRRKEKRKSPSPPTTVSPSMPTPQKSKESKRIPQERSSPMLDGLEDDRPRKRARMHHPQEGKRTPLPRHSGNIHSGKNLSHDGSTSVPSYRKEKGGLRSSPIGEIIPASDDEVDGLVETFLSSPQQSYASKANTQVQNVHRDLESMVASGSSIVTSPRDEDNLAGVCTVDESDPLFDAPEDQLNIPHHRARAANPLVKIAENPKFAGVEGAIPVKSRLAGHNSVISPAASAKPRKPGPGRSSSGLMKNSLLTFQKGELKTVKGSYKKQTDKSMRELEVANDGNNDDSMEENGNSHHQDHTLIDNGTAQATGDELLGLAGLDAENAKNLSDFEDDVPPATQVLTPNTQPLSSTPAPQPDSAELARQRSLASLALTKDKLLPSVATAGVVNIPNTTWRRSTIFDALGLDSDAATVSNIVASESASPFSLNLDSTVSVPVMLTHPSASMETIVGKRGPPGKFYSQQAAMTLLDTVRTGRASGKVVADPNTTEDQKVHFDHFCARLKGGELFVAIAGMDVLAFCSSDNISISQRLNISPSILGHAGEVLVAQIIIENHSAYADAAVNADGREWSRYLLAV